MIPSGDSFSIDSGFQDNTQTFNNSSHFYIIYH